MSKKEALITSAQKFLQKGLTERALSCYQEAAALDPADQRLRQRLAELLAKCRRFEDARKELEIIGKALAANGFYLKAIAVYKQIEKFFPDDISVTITLALLHEKHGLAANALADYKRVYDHYSRLGNSSETLKTLEAMRRVDPHNPAVLLKCAEEYYRAGRHEEALDGFRALGALLVDRGDADGFIRLVRHVMQCFPETAEFAEAIIERKIEEGASERLLQVADSLVRQNPDDAAGWRLQLSAQHCLGETAALKKNAQDCLTRFPEALFPRERLISCYLAEQDIQAALELLEESEPLFLAQGAAATLKMLYLQLDEMAPINLRILNGCVRAAQAAGNDQDAETFQVKIASMAGLPNGEVAAESDKRLTESSENSTEEPAITPSAELYDDVSDALNQDSAAVALPTEEVEAVELPADDLYEIEVEFDVDFDATSNTASSGWLETVTGFFDSIQADAGKVRFAEGTEQDDFQSQYDLGTAFYEMGLYDEAIQAYRQASHDPKRRISCLVSIGACLRGKGALPLAENALRTLLTSSDISTENLCAATYELAQVCSAQGNDDEAEHLLKEVYLLDPHFQNRSGRSQAADVGDEVAFEFGDDELPEFELK